MGAGPYKPLFFPVVAAPVLAYIPLMTTMETKSETCNKGANVNEGKLVFNQHFAVSMAIFLICFLSDIPVTPFHKWTVFFMGCFIVLLNVVLYFVCRDIASGIDKAN